MNSKAIRKQLLAAVAMVLVAAVALGSSTYAWFVQGGTVKATGMKVNLQSEGGLLIRYKDSGGWGVTATATTTTAQAKTLTPVSTKTMATWSFAEAAGTGAATAQQATRKAVTNDIFTGGDVTKYIANNNYVLMEDFYIRSANPSKVGNGLKVPQIEVTTANKLISTSLRVGVLVKGTTDKPFIYGPVTVTGSDNKSNSATQAYKFYTDAADQTGADVELSNASTLILDAGTKIPATGDPVHVQIFIWYEGEDTNCYTDVLDTEDLSITVQFEANTYEGTAT